MQMPPLSVFGGEPTPFALARTPHPTHATVGNARCAVCNAYKNIKKHSPNTRARAHNTLHVTISALNEDTPSLRVSLRVAHPRHRRWLVHPTHATVGDAQSAMLTKIKKHSPNTGARANNTLQVTISAHKM